MKNFGLSQMDIQGQLIQNRAEITITQVYFNHSRKNLEFSYVFPIPPKAHLSGFTLKIGDREIKSEIVESEEAYRQYDKAILQGDSTAIIESIRKDILELSLGNIPPNETASIQLTYLQELSASDEGQSLQWRIPTVLAPRYSKELSPDKLRAQPHIGVHETRFNLELHLSMLSPIDTLSCPSHPVSIALDGHQARIKLAKANEVPDSDFVLNIMLKDTASKQSLTTVNSTQGTFSLIQLSPEIQESPLQEKPRSYTFILDRSGSMSGEKLKQAQLAVKLCLRQLSGQDSFNLLAFDNEFYCFSPHALSFTDEALKKADSWVDAIYARGGTEIYAPLEYALKALAPDKENMVLLFTDGQVSDECPTLRLVETYASQLQLYPFGIDTTVNSSFIDGLAEVGGGVAEYIYPGESLEDKILCQFGRIHSPWLEKGRILDALGHEVEVIPAIPSRLFTGEQYHFLHKHEGNQSLQKLSLHAVQNGEELVIPLVFLQTENCETLNHLPSWWALEKIRYLEYRLNNCIPRRKKLLEKEILALSIQYQVLSTLSSLVAVMPRTEKVKGMPDFIKIPVAPPRQWEMLMSDTKLMLSQFSHDNCMEFLKEPCNSRGLGKTAASMPAPLLADPLEGLIQSAALMQNADGSVGQGKDTTKSTVLFVFGMIFSGKTLRKYRKALQKAIHWLAEHASTHPLLVSCGLYWGQSRLQISPLVTSTMINQCQSLMNTSEITIFEEFKSAKVISLWQSIYPEVTEKYSDAELAELILKDLSKG